jgi:hypothetical protein
MGVKSAFVRDTKSKLWLYNVLYRIAQNILHTHTFLKMSRFQPRRTVDQIKRKLAKIQILRLPRNAYKSSWGSKDSSQQKENASFMTVFFSDLFSSTDKQSAVLATVGSYFVHKYR